MVHSGIEMNKLNAGSVNCTFFNICLCYFLYFRYGNHSFFSVQTNLYDTKYVWRSTNFWIFRILRYGVWKLANQIQWYFVYRIEHFFETEIVSFFLGLSAYIDTIFMYTIPFFVFWSPDFWDFQFFVWFQHLSVSHYVCTEK